MYNRYGQPQNVYGVQKLVEELQIQQMDHNILVHHMVYHQSVNQLQIIHLQIQRAQKYQWKRYVKLIIFINY